MASFLSGKRKRLDNAAAPAPGVTPLSDLDDGPVDMRKRPRVAASSHAQPESRLATASTAECDISTLSAQAPRGSPSSGARKAPENPGDDDTESSAHVEVQDKSMDKSNHSSSSESLSITSSSNSGSDGNHSNKEHAASSSLGSVSFSDSEASDEGGHLGLGSAMGGLRMNTQTAQQTFRLSRKIAREETRQHPSLTFESYLEDVEGYFTKVHRIDTRTWAHEAYGPGVKGKRRLVKSWTLVHKRSPQPGRSEFYCSNCRDFDLYKSCVHVLYTEMKVADAMPRIVKTGESFAFACVPFSRMGCG